MAGIIKAVLGPTNTGKTHYAVERMMGYASGLMGFPLRLLAREIYDRVVAIKGKNQVALLTGEERIVPEGARYYLCTAEAMPRHKVVDFVAVDEIQMAADPQRGHIFTEHFLHTRGKHETLLLGAETMRPLIRKLIPEAEIITRERFSNLSYVRPAKLSKLPRRSAVVGFSANDVYGMAELVRRQKGGAAIVMGALSPRTRNAQVEMYQSGEVDHLIATDAIGMGLNLDVSHVSFASLAKFDGRVYRGLTPAEAAQIAGRAGRYQTDGTFSTLKGGDDDAMDPLMVAQIEEHKFEPIKSLFWRNQRLDFSSIRSLERSLEQPTRTEGLHRSRDSLDQAILSSFVADSDVADMAVHKEAVIRLWDICQIPDFRKLSKEDHTSLLKRIYLDLMSSAGAISHDWIAKQVKRLDNTDGDIDTLAGRIASIRVWTYISHKKDWLNDAAHWAHVTRSVEDRLSDALHEKLTQRFVDRRTAVLMRSLRQRDTLSVSIDSETNQVSVEGHEIGELNGFSFRVDASSVPGEQKTLQAAAESALQIELSRRAKLFANVGYKTLEFDFGEGLALPKLVWEGAPVATVHDSGALFAPRVKLVQSTLLTGDLADLVRDKIQEWLDTRIAEKLEPLIKLAQELNGEIEAPEGAAPLSGLARGVAFRLLEHYGVMPRNAVDDDLRQLDQDARKGLRRFGIRIGASSLYIPIIMKPHATELRLAMWAMAGKKADLPTIPTPGMVWVEAAETAPREFYELAGFQVVGKKAVRMDMLERLSDAVRPLGQQRGWFEVTPEIMGLVGLSGEDFADVMKAAGYKNELRKVPPVPQEAVAVAEKQSTEAIDAPAADNKESKTEDTTTEIPEITTIEEEAIKSVSSEGAPDTNVSDATSPEADVSKAEAQEPEADKAEPVVESKVEEVASSDAEAKAEDNTEAESAEAETKEEELVERYFFTWAPKRKPRPSQNNEKRRSSQGKDGKGKTGQPHSNRGKSDHYKRPSVKGGKAGPQKHAARPPRREKKADPDSPFAALAGLKDALTQKK